MGFRPISVEEKIAVLCEVIEKGKIEPVARGCRVSKTSVYVRLERSQEALRKGLEPHKRGPKFKRNPEDKRLEEIKRLREGFNPDKEDFRPAKHLHCGFEKVYKNGTYKRKPKGFFDRLKQDEQKEESVQGFFVPLVRQELSYRKKGVFSTLT